MKPAGTTIIILKVYNSVVVSNITVKVRKIYLLWNLLDTFVKFSRIKMYKSI